MPVALQSLEVPTCSSDCEVVELPPRPTQNAAELLPLVHVAAGCVQLPLTELKVWPLTAYPDQLLETSAAARAVPARDAAAAEATTVERKSRRRTWVKGFLSVIGSASKAVGAESELGAG